MDHFHPVCHHRISGEWKKSTNRVFPLVSNRQSLLLRPPLAIKCCDIKETSSLKRTRGGKGEMATICNILAIDQWKIKSIAMQSGQRIAIFSAKWREKHFFLVQWTTTHPVAAINFHLLFPLFVNQFISYWLSIRPATLALPSSQQNRSSSRSLTTSSGKQDSTINRGLVCVCIYSILFDNIRGID